MSRDRLTLFRRLGLLPFSPKKTVAEKHRRFRGISPKQVRNPTQCLQDSLGPGEFQFSFQKTAILGCGRQALDHTVT